MTKFDSCYEWGGRYCPIAQTSCAQSKCALYHHGRKPSDDGCVLHDIAEGLTNIAIGVDVVADAQQGNERKRDADGYWD